MLLGGPAVGLGAGVSGQSWGPRTRPRTGPWATLGLPVLGAWHSRARFPAGDLGAIGGGAVPRGSQGPRRLREAIFIPWDSVVVEPLALGEREQSE